MLDIIFKILRLRYKSLIEKFSLEIFSEFPSPSPRVDWEHLAMVLRHAADASGRARLAEFLWDG